MVTALSQMLHSAALDDSGMWPTGCLLKNQHACQVITWGAFQWLNCVDQVYNTNVWHRNARLHQIAPLTRQMKVDTADPTGHDLSLKVPLGIGSKCLNACVIKSMLRLSCLHLTDAKAPINDFNLGRGWKLTSHTTLLLRLCTDPVS